MLTTSTCYLQLLEVADKQSLLDEVEEWVASYLDIIFPFLAVTADPDRSMAENVGTLDTVVTDSVEEAVKWATLLKEQGKMNEVTNAGMYIYVLHY